MAKIPYFDLESFFLESFFSPKVPLRPSGGADDSTPLEVMAKAVRDYEQEFLPDGVWRTPAFPPGEVINPGWNSNLEFEAAVKEAERLKIYPPVSPSPEHMLEFETRVSKRLDTFIPGKDFNYRAPRHVLRGI